MKIVIFQSSDTQRIAINIKPKKSSILLSKEWRKTTGDGWKLGKSIEIPYNCVYNLGKILSEIYDNRVVIYEGSQNITQLCGYEVIQDENTDNGDKEDTNSSW